MKAVASRTPADAVRILGVTEGDLAIPTLKFVFGQAQLDGPVAVVSLARLRQEF
jgi:predicted Zn-dependent protease